MDKGRAKEIASSPIMADVRYNGKPIYIESVNEKKGTAKIHPLDRTVIVEEVSLNNLIEQ